MQCVHLRGFKSSLPHERDRVIVGRCAQAASLRSPASSGFADVRPAETITVGQHNRMPEFVRGHVRVAKPQVRWTVPDSVQEEPYDAGILVLPLSGMQAR